MFFSPRYDALMKAQTYQERIQKVLRYIDAHREEKPALETLAAVACFSSCHFHRIFVAMVGEGVASYMRRLSLQAAAKQLLYSRKKVTDIALDAGYDSLEAFSRAFKIRYGVTPSQCRRNGMKHPCMEMTREMYPLYYHLNLKDCSMDVHIRTFPVVLTAAVRYTGPYDQSGPAWETLWGELGKRNLIAPETLAISVCHDDPDVTPNDKLRMECCLTLPEGTTEQSPELHDLVSTTNLYLRHVGGGEYAAMLIRGPYSLLHPAYRSLFGHWFPQSGREPDNAPSFEIYYNNPQECAPEDLKTEIFIPLKPR